MQISIQNSYRLVLEMKFKVAASLIRFEVDRFETRKCLIGNCLFDLIKMIIQFEICEKNAAFHMQKT